MEITSDPEVFLEGKNRPVHRGKQERTLKDDKIDNVVSVGNDIVKNKKYIDFQGRAGNGTSFHAVKPSNYRIGTHCRPKIDILSKHKGKVK